MKTLRAAQQDLLAAIGREIEVISPDVSGDFVLFRTPGGSAKVARNRERLERFAAAVRSCPGYRPVGRQKMVPRDRECGRAMRATEPDDMIRSLCDRSIQRRLADRKARVMDRMREALADLCTYPPELRVADAEEIDALQRELVRRGLLDATDHDKINAAPVYETLPEAAPAPARRRASKPVRKCKPAPLVEVVEAIECIDGSLSLVAFDEDFEIIGLYRNVQQHLDAFPRLPDALQQLSNGLVSGWPGKSRNPQRDYDSVTLHPDHYRVIGRWTSDRGVCLDELHLSTGPGFAWAAHREPLAA